MCLCDRLFLGPLRSEAAAVPAGLTVGCRLPPGKALPGIRFQSGGTLVKKVRTFDLTDGH